MVCSAQLACLAVCVHGSRSGRCCRGLCWGSKHSLPAALGHEAGMGHAAGRGVGWSRGCFGLLVRCSAGMGHAWVACVLAWQFWHVLSGRWWCHTVAYCLSRQQQRQEQQQSMLCMVRCYVALNESFRCLVQQKMHRLGMRSMLPSAQDTAAGSFQQEATFRTR